MKVDQNCHMASVRSFKVGAQLIATTV